MAERITAEWRRPLVAVLAALALLCALLVWRPWDGSGGDDRSGSGTVPDGPPGAAALRGVDWSTVRAVPEEAFTRTGDYVPATPEAADGDQPAYYADDCHLEREDTGIKACTYGDEDATVEVAVVGSSKAGVWVPVLDEIGRREGWRVSVFTKSSCAYDPPVATDSYPECATYNTALEERLLADPPDIVVTSGQDTDARQLEAAALSAAWLRLLEAGTEHVVAVWEVPTPSRHVAGCLAELPRQGSGDYVEACSYEHEDGPGADILGEAVAQTDGAELLDVKDWVCPDSTLSPRCPPVIGAVVVLGDGAHLTDTYARTLTDPVHQELSDLGIATSQPTDP
ncbi:SGNH hydrolase domain-containing protein [Ornithinicoccus hortensis]|uniref:SGNH domain-containing protein n=1 Tax=Ornithinicoccus hortensis TaxID=82346 RepID=A0A542YT33_9MICO|nr:SGNH hydrolase domain-containing protein [Ornithinicoccus hortensis]TQL51255.1 hypothetical protein FB467_2396 [Ornithinicoccus hortensis]